MLYIVSIQRYPVGGINFKDGTTIPFIDDKNGINLWVKEESFSDLLDAVAFYKRFSEGIILSRNKIFDQWKKIEYVGEDGTSHILKESPRLSKAQMAMAGRSGRSKGIFL